MLTDPTGTDGVCEVENLVCSIDPGRDVSGECTSQTSQEPSWFLRVTEEEDKKARVRQGIRAMNAVVAAERVAQGRTPEVDFSSTTEIQQDTEALIAYNNAVWQANKALREASEARRQYEAEQQYRQYEWNASGEGGAPPEGWQPRERPLIPGTGEYMGTMGREAVLAAATTPRTVGMLLGRVATSEAIAVIEIAGAERSGFSGARTLTATDWGAAENIYNVIRVTDDVGTIAANTGMRESWVARIKDHLFFRTHRLDAGVARFDADPFIANAWNRLQAGTHTANDLALLRHELFEARFEGIFRTNYRTAHDAALRAGRTWEWKP